MKLVSSIRRLLRSPNGASDSIASVRNRLGKFACAVESHQADVGRLVGGGVLAGGLAERRGARRAVEDVVDDLEEQAGALGKAVECSRISALIASPHKAPSMTAARISAPVFSACMSSSSGWFSA
jgi:hypothetical protein